MLSQKGSALQGLRWSECVPTTARSTLNIFHGSDGQDSWSLQVHGLLPLGLVFDDFGGLGPILQQLHSAGQGERAKFLRPRKPGWLNGRSEISLSRQLLHVGVLATSRSQCS